MEKCTTQCMAKCVQRRCARKILTKFFTPPAEKICKQELSEQRVKQLRNIPGFGCAQLEKRWNDTYVQLCNWVDKRCATEDRCKRCLPSHHSTDLEEKRLGEWIKNQRAEAKHCGQNQAVVQRKALLEAITGWTWEQDEGVTKQYSDTCPRCKQIIHFDKADAQDLDHEHDNGEGGKCRFRGSVVSGRIQANLCEQNKRFKISGHACA